MPNKDVAELALWYGLSAVNGIPSPQKLELVDRFGGPAGLLSVPSSDLAEFVTRASLLKDRIRHFGRSLDLQSLTKWLRAPSHHVLTVLDPAYPKLLRQIADPPLLLFVQGDYHRLGASQIAVVGSRNPTPTGRRCARTLAEQLSRAGLVVTSGLALGIDSEAHRGALQAKLPTIAVAATGLDQVYPREHAELAVRIASAGAIVSEFPLGTGPRRHHFPQRNRLISGLCLGVVVVEAAQRSGSLITARLAADQNREVFAIPGSIYSNLSHGCHRLIQQGAKLVENSDDVLEELPQFLNRKVVNADRIPSSQDATDAWPQHAKLFEHMDFDPCSVDELVHRSGLTAAKVSSMLLQLELEGRVAACSDGLFVRLP